jgi:hypothetical protein
MPQETVDSYFDDKVISGIWKFDKQKVTPEDLVFFAKELVQEESEAYQNMKVRSCSKTTWGICFDYDRRRSGNPGVYSYFFDRITDKLKRKFGNGFVGWDITDSVWIVKTASAPVTASVSFSEGREAYIKLDGHSSNMKALIDGVWSRHGDFVAVIKSGSTPEHIILAVIGNEPMFPRSN